VGLAGRQVGEHVLYAPALTVARRGPARQVEATEGLPHASQLGVVVREGIPGLDLLEPVHGSSVGGAGVSAGDRRLRRGCGGGASTEAQTRRLSRLPGLPAVTA